MVFQLANLAWSSPVGPLAEEELQQIFFDEISPNLLETCPELAIFI
jgi:hypothetical protein